MAVLRKVAVGVSCTAAPVACPAIVAIDRAVTLAQITSKVYRAYSEARTREEGLKHAGREAGVAAVSESLTKVVQDANEAKMVSAASTIGVAVSKEASGTFHVDPEVVREIATQTAHSTMRGGVDGVVSWAVEGAGRVG